MRGQLPGSKSLHSVLSWAIDVMQTPIRNESKRYSLVVAVTIMRRTLIMLSALVITMMISGTLAQAKTRCVIADPTETPLNVRTVPNGKIVTTLGNGYFVSVIDTALDRNHKPWAYVSDYETDRPIGWVYRKFIVWL
jgi:hypothetical protein